MMRPLLLLAAATLAHAQYDLLIRNARVVDGGEIGAAQWLQARAAGVAPDVRMNPVLLKPEQAAGSDRQSPRYTSQVIRLGVVDRELSARPWQGRGADRNHVGPDMSERERGSATCPECGGRDLRPLVGTFFSKTSRKS